MKIVSIGIKQTTKGDDYKMVELEDGKKFNIFKHHSRYDEMSPEIDISPDDLIKDGKWLNLKDPNEKPKTGGYKTNQIREAQTNKANQISKAQDRTAMLWAKVNASTLVAHHPAYKELSIEEVERKISELASKILNDELQPF